MCQLKLKKTSLFQVNQNILSLFYKSVIESILCFSLTVYYGNSNKKDLKRLNNITRKASKIIGIECVSLSELFCKYCCARTKSIVTNCKHPLYNLYVKMRSSEHFISRRCLTCRLLRSFVPESIRQHNKSYPRTFFDIQLV